MPEHIDIGVALAAAGLDRRQHLVGGAARVGAAVRQAGEGRRQFGSDPVTEDRNHDVALGRFRDLRLKGGMRPVELGFPADGLEPRGPGEFAVQALDDAVDATTLMCGVARRGNKDAAQREFAQDGAAPLDD